MMQKKLLSLLVLLMTAATGAWAGVDAGGLNSGIEWQLTDDGVMTISKQSGSGAMADYSSYDTQTWISQRQNHKRRGRGWRDSHRQLFVLRFNEPENGIAPRRTADYR